MTLCSRVFIGSARTGGGVSRAGASLRPPPASPARGEFLAADGAAAAATDSSKLCETETLARFWLHARAADARLAGEQSDVVLTVPVF